MPDDIISVSYFVHVTIIVTVPFLLFGVEAVGDVVAEVENTLVIHCRIELILEAMSFVIFHIFLHVNLKRKIDHIVNFAVHLHSLHGENHHWSQSYNFLLLFDSLEIFTFPAVITGIICANGLFVSKAF